MAPRDPRPFGSYMWGKTKDGVGGAWRGAWEGGSNIAAEVGNTYQAVLWGQAGWGTQSAHNHSMRVAEAQAIEDDNKRIEPEIGIAQDGPEKQ